MKRGIAKGPAGLPVLLLFSCVRLRQAGVGQGFICVHILQGASLRFPDDPLKKHRVGIDQKLDIVVASQVVADRPQKALGAAEGLGVILHLPIIAEGKIVAIQIGNRVL